MQMDIVNHTLLVVDAAPQSVQATAVQGAGVDFRGHRYAVSRVSVGALGADNTVDVKIQYKTGSSSWADLPGAVHAQLADGGDGESGVLGPGLIDLTKIPSAIYATEPELRHHITVAGTAAVLVGANFELAGHYDPSAAYGATNNPRGFQVIADGS